MAARGAVLLGAVLLAACAAFDGRTLEPGKSTAEEVTALMGAPGMQVKRPDGDTLLYFARHPWGRQTYVATIGADGVLRGIEQRLTYDNIHSVKQGMRKEQVQELLGPPRRITSMPFKAREIWEYPWWHATREMRVLWVYFSDDGVAREVVEQHDYEDQPENSRN